MTLKKLKPGDTVYSIHRYKMGNTTIKTVGYYPVKIVSVDEEKRRVTASQNHNPPTTFYEKQWSKWHAEKPVFVKTGMSQRLATKEETKKIREEEETERLAREAAKTTASAETGNPS